MPKASKKHYAICIGRKGPQIVDNWEECKAQVTRYPGAIHRSFPTLKEAQQWLDNELKVRGNSIPRGPCPVENSQKPVAPTPSIADVHTSPTAPTESAPLATSASGELIVLSPEQQQVLNMVKQGQSVFFTGSAGTGKSVLLREIIGWGKDCHMRLGITASTGIAAVNIGGSTLHSWAGIGLGDQKIENYIGKFYGTKRFENIKHRWKDVDILIIDEISMLDGELFDKLEAIGRGMRNNHHPFGGIQLVLCGDFFQLPPVSRDDKMKFAFEASSWEACVGTPVFLSRVYRQKNISLVDMLNAMRFGKLDVHMIQEFRALSRKVVYTDGIEPTELYPTREDVNKSNFARLRDLDGERHSYIASDRAGVDSYGQPVPEEKLDKILERLVAPKYLQLKVGAQVMLVKNLVQGRLVNGSVGIVIRFCTISQATQEHIDIPVLGEDKKPPPCDGRLYPVVQFDGQWVKETLCLRQEFSVDNADGSFEARRTQVPLILAWALSIHKSQGQTLQRVKVDLKKIFEAGQAYVALSRAVQLETLEVLNFDHKKVQAHPRVTAWYAQHAPAALREQEGGDMEIDSDEENLPPPDVAFL